MKPRSIVFLFLILITLAEFKSAHSEISRGSDLNSGVASLKSLQRSPGRSLLAFEEKHGKTLFVYTDGTIHLLDNDSGAIRWTFPSGSSISSMYQEEPDGDNDKKKPTLFDADMELSSDERFVVVSDDFNEEESLMKAVADYVNSAPHISKDGVTLGGKKTTVFVLDAKNGSLIESHHFNDFQPRLGAPSAGDENALLKHDTKKLVEPCLVDLETAPLVYITRTDYLLQYSALNTRKVLSSANVANIRAYFLHMEKKSHLPVVHAYQRTFLKNFLQQYMPNHSYEKLHPTPETTAIAFAGNKDRNSMPLAIAGTADHTSLSLVKDLNNSMPYHHSNLLNKTILCSLVVLLVFVISYKGLIMITKCKFTKKINDSNGYQSGAPKKKRVRKLGNYKNSSNIKKSETISSDEGEKIEGFPSTGRNGKESWQNLATPAVTANGRKVGKLFISNVEIAKGSNGTIVLEGKHDGRPVAVKRLVQAHHDVAYKEIQNLIASDQHPNIVRWYGVEHDSDFVYLSLERCTCSLNDLIQTCSGSSHTVFTTGNIMNSVNGYNVQKDSAKGAGNEVELWKANGYPSTQLLKLMRDVVSGLVHLHELGIIHRDLKPQNILIVDGRSLCAKLSDMGISKRLLGDNASLGHHPTGFGSSGWQSPEQLLHGRQTRAVDLFSLGCVLFFCMTGGKHPYGDHLERDINIVKNRVDLFLVEHIPEAVDLFSRLLDPNPELRPTALDVMHHPLFWSSEMRLSFLRDASDRVELEDRENGSILLKELESVAPLALGGKWDEKMEGAFLTNIGRYRRYKFDSTRDLLRVMRNKLNHYRELPKEIQELLGSVPEGFDGYFASRFPKFLIEVYKVIANYCREEECFVKYFTSFI